MIVLFTDGNEYDIQNGICFILELFRVNNVGSNPYILIRSQKPLYS